MRPESSPTEKHYTVDQVAEMWNLSKDSVQRLFRHGGRCPKDHAPWKSLRARLTSGRRLPFRGSQEVHALAPLVLARFDSAA